MYIDFCSALFSHCMLLCFYSLLGSFLMGMLQNHEVLGLAVPMRWAWLSPHHPLQRAVPLYTAATTGFCGSLTTFSSWNSEMVVLLLGANITTNRHSQFFRMLLGYIIGMETALGSFVCGCAVARRWHQWCHPALAAEVRARRPGIHVNTALPDLERRFLADLPTQDLYSAAERIRDLQA